MTLLLCFFFILGSHLVFRDYTWLCTQEFLLMVLRESCIMVGIEPGSAACRANNIPAVPSLRLNLTFIAL